MSLVNNLVKSNLVAESLSNEILEKTDLSLNHTNYKIQKSLSFNKKPKPHHDELGFGKYFTDHMLVSTYKNGVWNTPIIQAYQSLNLDPASSVLHYGQALFEGMKAFTLADGSTALFRPEYNWKRLNLGAERLCMPQIPRDLFLEGIKELIRVDADWIPQESNCSLYIRPTLIGTEAFLGVRPSNEYLFFTILSPVGSYYGNSLNKGIKIWIEEEFVRAAPGGLGATKAAANYANSLFATQKAKDNHFAQVLWLDVNHQFVEEVGTMNVFFVFKNRIVTPELHGTILAGGVRDCVIQILKSWNYSVEVRPLSLKEICDSSDSKQLIEVFGTGTAAVITSIEELHRKSGSPIQLPHNGMGPLAQKLFDTLTGIQRGTIADSYHWLERI